MNKILCSKVAQVRELLETSQNSDGSFFSYSSRKKEGFSQAKKYKTVFGNALILLCLSEITVLDVKTIKDRLAGYLWHQKKDGWLFNYWDKKCIEARKYRVPNDLDDSFVALAALYKYDKNLFKPKDYARITNILTQMEVKEGGPYRTWWVDEGFDRKWRDVDVAVNANIAYFLYLNDINLPNLEEYFNRVIFEWNLRSKYYPNVYSTIFYLSRFYSGPCKSRLAGWLKRKRLSDGSWGNSLNTALAVVSLINLCGNFEGMSESIDWLVHKQVNGSWPAAGFCLDPMIAGRKYFSGSNQLTSAFVMMAIDKYLINTSAYVGAGLSRPCRSQEPLEQNKIYRRVIDNAKTEFKKLKNPLKKDCLNFLNIIIDKDEDGEIILLPHNVAKSLNTRTEQEKIEKLCQASLYGWIAYTLYDNFLDKEAKPWMLPVANVCFSSLKNIYSSIDIPDFTIWSEKLLIIMGEANSWEVNNTSFNFINDITFNDLPDYGKLNVIADKSIGHALGGIGVLLLAGNNGQDVKNLYEYFQNYLIARQLNDDAHDWEEDLKRGHINSAGRIALDDYFIKWGKDDFNLTRDIGNLRVLFWQNSIKKISKIILDTNVKARNYIDTVGGIKDRSFYYQRLKKLDKAAITAVKEAEAVQEYVDELGK